MFAGLKSRCTIPSWWAAPSAAWTEDAHRRDRRERPAALEAVPERLADEELHHEKRVPLVVTPKSKISTTSR